MKGLLRYAALLSIFALIVIAFAILSRSHEPESGKISVVTSITPLADIIENVGGDKVKVTALVPPGTDPHDFEPRPSDLVEVSKARLFFANGLGLEKYLNRLVESARSQNLRVVTLSEGLEVLDKGSAEFGSSGNPHLWLAVDNAIAYARKVRDSLISIDPKNKDYYSKRFSKYQAELNGLDRWIKLETSRVPPENRRLIVFHNAWSYYAKRYGFSVEGAISTGQTESEPSADKWKDLLRLIRNRNVRAVIAEKGFGERIASSLARDAGINFAGSLLSDTIGSGRDNDTYIKMMRYNTTQIVRSLK